MLRNGWNFHNDIAIQLERIAREEFEKEHSRPYGKVYDADFIDSYTFAECLILLVRKNMNYRADNEVLEEFVKKCYPLMGKSGSMIEDETAQGLFDEFKRLMEI